MIIYESQLCAGDISDVDSLDLKYHKQASGGIIMFSFFRLRISFHHWDEPGHILYSIGVGNLIFFLLFFLYSCTTIRWAHIRKYLYSANLWGVNDAANVFIVSAYSSAESLRGVAVDTVGFGVVNQLWRRLKANFFEYVKLFLWSNWGRTLGDEPTSWSEEYSISARDPGVWKQHPFLFDEKTREQGTGESEDEQKLHGMKILKWNLNFLYENLKKVLV